MESLHFSTSVPYDLDFRNAVADKMQCTYNVLNIDYHKHHNHKDFWEFTILVEGNIINFLNGEQFIYEKGTMFFLTCEDCHHIKRKGNSQIRYINLMVKKDHIIKYLSSISDDFLNYILKCPRNVILPNHIILSIENIVHKANMLTKNEYITHSNLIFSAIMLIVQHLYTLYIKPIEYKQEWQIKLASLIDTTEFLTCSTKDLCVLLNYSKAQLNRLFKEHFNLSPHDYLQEYKFTYAQNILILTNEKIIDIATKIGYKNLSQFNVIFKRKFNMTPGEYRKKNKN